MLRHLCALVRTTVWSLVFAACGSASGAGLDQRLAASMGELGPRVVLLYADVSASVPDTAWHASLRRLSRELRPGDRVALFALGGRAPDAPILDTIVAGGVAERLSSGLGLSTKVSRREHDLVADGLAGAMLAATARARAADLGSRTAVLDAVCHAVATSQTVTTGQTVAVLFTDAQEESPLANLARTRPTAAHARQLAGAIRRDGRCPTDGEWPVLRLVGLRHPTDTPALRRWWETLLGDLGAPPLRTDVTTHTLSGLLDEPIRISTAVRDPRGTPTTLPSREATP
jgi:hypothetical protein